MCQLLKLLRIPLRPMSRMVLAETRIPAGLLELELTESAIIRNPAESAVLRCTNCALWVSGWRSMISATDILPSRSCIHLPLDTLKIDRSFMSNMEQSSTRSALFETIVALG